MNRSAPVPRAPVSIAIPALALASAALCLFAALPASAGNVAPLNAPEPVQLEISGKVYSYFPLESGSALRFAIDGPVTFEPILRWRFDGDAQAADVDVEFLLDGAPLLHQVFRASKGKVSYPDHPDATAGSPVRVPIDIAGGTHSVEIVLHAPETGTLDVNPVIKPPKALPWKIAWRLEAGVAYDSNIFRYTDADVDDFIDGVDAEDYQAEYLDDVRVEPSVDVYLVRERPGRGQTQVRLSADGRLATVNGEKSFVKFGARLKEIATGVGYGSLGYEAIPSYHVRELYDVDVTSGDRYRPCEFRKHSMRGELGTDRLLPVDMVLGGRYEYMGYNQYFVEYDSHAWTSSITVIARPVRGVRVDLGYALRRLDARGYDETIEESGVSDDSDIDYEQDEYRLKVRWDVGRVLGYRTALTFGARLAERYYQTSKSAEDDPYHAGREDTYWTFSGRSSHRLAEGVTFEAFLEHRRRASESERLEELGVDKDYTANRVGIRLIFEGERFLD